MIKQTSDKPLMYITILSLLNRFKVVLKSCKQIIYLNIMHNLYFLYKKETGLSSVVEIEAEFFPQRDGINAVEGKVMTYKSDIESLPTKVEIYHTNYGFSLLITAPTSAYIAWLESKLFETSII
jgi:hypothetical protein